MSEKKISLSIALFGLWMLISCTQTTSDTEKATTNIKETTATGQSVENPVIKNTRLYQELEKAKSEKKTVFLVVSEGAQSIEKVMKAATQAAKVEKQSCILQLKRDDQENAGLVSKFGLEGAPLPMVLVIANNGVAIGGVEEKDVTADTILYFIPTPRQADIYLAIEKKKVTFFVVSKPGFKDLQPVLENCKKAISSSKIPVEIIEADLSDPKETAFYQQLGVNLQSKQTQTVVLNAEGSIAGNFSGIPVVTKLVEAAKSVVKSCCPPGKSC